MGTKPIEHRPAFQKSFDEAKNRFTREFLLDFSNENGSINWDKLLAFNSGKERPKSPTPEKIKKPIKSAGEH